MISDVRTDTSRVLPVTRVSEETGGWDMRTGKEQAFRQYAVRQTYLVFLSTFSSTFRVVIYSETQSVVRVLSSFNCRCIYSNSKLHESVKRYYILLCSAYFVSSPTPRVVQLHYKTHKVSVRSSYTVRECIRCDIAFRTCL
jgi:hypothetical protein